MEIPIHVVNFHGIDMGNMSASSVQSNSLDIKEVRDVAVQVTWTGTLPVGSLAVEASNDGVNFGVIETLSVSGNSGTKILLYSRLGVNFIRAVYTRTSGDGALDVYINGKR